MWPSLVHARLNRSKRVRVAVEEQNQEDLKGIDAAWNMTSGNSLYLKAVDKSFENTSCIEIITDGSAFGSQHTELFAVYRPDCNLAAFLSPLNVRALCSLAPWAWGVLVVPDASAVSHAPGFHGLPPSFQSKLRVQGGAPV